MKLQEALCIGSILVLTLILYLFSVFTSERDTPLAQAKPVKASFEGSNVVKLPIEAIASKPDSLPESELENSIKTIPKLGDSLNALDLKFLSSALTEASKKVDLSALKDHPNEVAFWALSGERQFRVLSGQEASELGVKNHEVRKQIPGANPLTQVLTVVSDPAGLAKANTENADARYITTTQYLTLDAAEEKKLMEILRSGDKDAMSTHLAALMQEKIDGSTEQAAKPQGKKEKMISGIGIE